MFKKILIGLGAIVLLFIVIGVASGGGDDTADEPTAASDTSGDETEAVDTKSEAAETEVDEADKKGPMSVGNWEVVGKIVPKDDGLGDYTATFRVKNISDSDDQPAFTVNILKGDDIWGSLDCISSADVAPGSIGTVDCISTDKFRRGWSEITIENMF